MRTARDIARDLVRVKMRVQSQNERNVAGMTEDDRVELAVSQMRDSAVLLALEEEAKQWMQEQAQHVLSLNKEKWREPAQPTIVEDGPYELGDNG